MTMTKQIVSRLDSMQLNGFYIGPFLECVFDKWTTKQKIQEIDKCEKCASPIPLRTTYQDNMLVPQFCQWCGGKIIRTESPGYNDFVPIIEAEDIFKKHKIEPLQFVEDFREDCKAYYVSLASRYFSIQQYSFQYNWTPESVKQELNEAKTKYADLIADLKKRFGTKNVILHWGLVPCYYDW